MAECLKRTGSAAGEPYLLTPGPLTTALPVRRAMLKDWGSWDGEFRALTAELRRRLTAMLGSFLPQDSRTLVLANGAYGRRIAQSLAYLGRSHAVIDKGD